MLITIIVLDSVGAGELPDAAAFGDVGAHTLNHTLAAHAAQLPNLARLGLARLPGITTDAAHIPAVPAEGAYGRLKEVSPGKDTSTGHWEFMGVQLQHAFQVFPDGFPEEVMDRFDAATGRGAGQLHLDSILSGRGRRIRAKTLHQQDYVEAIDRSTVVFGIGPAGTGKTYLAMAKAVQALQAKEVNRIILTRPAVEAGERLGFLPGGLSEKIDPYLRPLYDALHDMIEPESIPRLMEAGTIEVAPLAYMRGRTLNDAFVILDEAQNTTGEQMKMFLTRLGFGARMVVTGDTSQVDLPRGTQSGLAQAVEVLEGIEGLEMVRFDSSDVVRHSLVSAIVDAYDAARGPAERSQKRGGARRGR